MVMVSDPLGMLVPMDQGLCEASPLRDVPGGIFRVPMMRKGLGSQPEQMRRRGGSKKEKCGELLAERHGRIVAHSASRGQTPAARLFLFPRLRRRSPHIVAV